jgi:hypothetical protein
VISPFTCSVDPRRAVPLGVVVFPKVEFDAIGIASPVEAGAFALGAFPVPVVMSC